MKSYGEQRAGECFGLLSNETIKMKPFSPPKMEDIYPYVDTTWEISLIDEVTQKQWQLLSTHGIKACKKKVN